MSRDNIIFYKSFYDSAQLLGDKARLKLYDSILELSFSGFENITELEQNCAKIETKLERFRNVFAQFCLIKPHILNSGKRYLNGKNGGAPLGNSNAKKQPKNKQLEREEEEYKKEEIYKEEKNQKFIKPTIEEIKAYCLERNNNIDAQTFLDYYEANGFKVGKNPMRDWRATIRTWERNQKNKEYANSSNSNMGGLF